MHMIVCHVQWKGMDQAQCIRLQVYQATGKLVAVTTAKATMVQLHSLGWS